MSKYSIGFSSDVRRKMWDKHRCLDPDHDDEPIKRSPDNVLLRPKGWSDGRFLMALNDEDFLKEGLFKEDTKVEFPEMKEEEVCEIMSLFFDEVSKTEGRVSSLGIPLSLKNSFESLFIVTRIGVRLFDHKFPGEEEFNLKVSRICLEYPFMLPQRSDELLSNMLLNYKAKSVLYNRADTRRIMLELERIGTHNKMQIYIYKCFRPYRYREGRSGIRNDVINSENFLYNNAAQWLLNSLKFSEDGTVMPQKAYPITTDEFVKGLVHCSLSEEAFNGVYCPEPCTDFYSQREIMATLFEKPIAKNSYICGNELLWLLGVDVSFGKWGLKKNEYGVITLHMHKSPECNMPWKIGHSELPDPPNFVRKS
jgi:hypothetical protein